MLGFLRGLIMVNQNWSRFPKTYKVASRLSDGRKVATLQELEEVIGLVIDGNLGGLDSNSNAYRDTFNLLEIIVHRDMPRALLTLNRIRLFTSFLKVKLNSKYYECLS